MAAAALRAVILPDDEAEMLWRPRTDFRLVTQLSYLDFATQRWNPHPRPSKRGIRPRTARDLQRKAMQLARIAGYECQPPYYYEFDAARDALEICQMQRIKKPSAPLSEAQRTWFRNPPPVKALWDLSQGHPSYEGHRKALLIWCAMHGVTGDDLPQFMQTAWDNEEDLEAAYADGSIEKRERFLDIIVEVPQLFTGSPYENDARRQCAARGHLVGCRRGTCMKRLARAKLEDEVWRCANVILFYLCRRQEDLLTLTYRNLRRRVRPDGSSVLAIVGWTQLKTLGKRIELNTREEWILNDPGSNLPSLTYYLRAVAPHLGGDTEPDAPVFRNVDGRPFTERTIQQFVSWGIQQVLGRNLSGHGPRRGGLTYRRFHGWSWDALATLAGHSETKTTKESYVDDQWIHDMGGRNEGARVENPRVPMLKPVKVEDAGILPESRARNAAPGRTRVVLPGSPSVLAGVGGVRPPPSEGGAGASMQDDGSSDDEPPSSFDTPPQPGLLTGLSFNHNLSGLDLRWSTTGVPFGGLSASDLAARSCGGPR